MNKLYKSLLDFTVLSFVFDNDIIYNLMLSFIVVITNCLIIPLIKKICDKISYKLKMSKQQKDNIKNQIPEILKKDEIK